MEEKGNIKELVRIYSFIRPAIISKFRYFNSAFYDKNSVMKELIFCLLTPQSKAESCWNAVQRIFEQKQECNNLSEGKIKELLRGVRFRNNKSKYVKEACKKFDEIYEAIKKQDSDPFMLRRWLVKHVKGMGCKEASHFLRNIGKGQELAILDRHVLNVLKEQNLIPGIPSSLSCKEYERIEQIMKHFAETINIPMHHLDFVFWMVNTQRIFK